MILLYTLVLFLLAFVMWLVRLRARALERKYVKVAGAVDALLRQPDYKPGNSNKADPCASAKRTLLLGQLVEQRDRVEAKHFAWQRWADRLTAWFTNVREWQGKKLPYTLGAVDVWMLMHLIDYLGVGQIVNTQTAVETVAALFTK
jgi:hypothetical protein